MTIPVDTETMHTVVETLIGATTLMGVVFGWFGKAWRFLTGTLTAKPEIGVMAVPSRTMVLQPVSRPNALWWHMGRNQDQPAMQIVGDLNVTNISIYDVYITGAKIRRPKATGFAIVRAQDSVMYSDKHVIPKGHVSDLRFHFFVMPPTRREGQLLKIDIAIVDQFANEHWLKDLEFPYT